MNDREIIRIEAVRLAVDLFVTDSVDDVDKVLAVAKRFEEFITEKPPGRDGGVVQAFSFGGSAQVY